jgi:hypothetical protein
MRVRSTRSLSLLAAAVMIAGGAVLAAQALPTTQPKIVQIYREHIKPGHGAAHRANESGWPDAFAQAKSPDYYLAMESMTGSPEVWFVGNQESYTAWGKAMERDAANATLTAATDRLSAADAEHLDGMDILEAVAAPELSHGAFPDLNTQRFWNITIWRIRPGHDADFVQAHAAYAKIASTSAPNASWRTYSVTGGMPTGTYITFSSVASFDQFDRNMAEGEATDKAMTPQDQAMFSKFFSEGVISHVSNKYRLDASMSYVSPETRASDPAFWNKK